jgi:hypothetical protein
MRFDDRRLADFAIGFIDQSQKQNRLNLPQLIGAVDSLKMRVLNLDLYQGGGAASC